ncbi:MAG: nodulation protein E [Candidatus Thiodiazotropha sp. (ex Ctena orbiculata)]|nr:nodulation protein E [Candidatus Thiodiazotropha taylori]
MSTSEQATQDEMMQIGPSAKEFLDYCNAERERRLNSGESFDEQTFDRAIEMVLNKLRVLADEGWS